MNAASIHQIIFLTLVRRISERRRARLLIESIRSFGGWMSACPVWLFEADPQQAPGDDFEGLGVQVFPLSMPDYVAHYVLGDKVFACAQAEELVTPTVHSLVWIDPGCLIIKPPSLFDLGQEFDAAVRPVHIRNVGLLAAADLDGYWEKVYATVGMDDIQTAVESFVDRQWIRSYFNTHAFAINPSLGLLRRWFEVFEALVCDVDFQRGACQDESHQVFLHQAVLSALLATSLDVKRIRVLPPDYNYPYNLHGSVPVDRRAAALDDLVCMAYEGRSLDPNLVDDIEIHDPLRSWLLTHAASSR